MDSCGILRNTPSDVGDKGHAVGSGMSADVDVDIPYMTCLRSPRLSFLWPRVMEMAPASSSKYSPKTMRDVVSETSSVMSNFSVSMSNLWHLEERGIPPLLVEENERTRSNRYAPWPEEKLTLQLSRPKGIGGQALTIDKSRLVLQPGIRATDATLSLTLRASRRDSHGLNVPEGAEVSKLTIDNRNHPIRVKDGVLSFSTKQQSRGSQTSANAPIEKKEGETPSSSAASAQALLKEEPRNPAQDGEQEDVSKPKKDAD